MKISKKKLKLIRKNIGYQIRAKLASRKPVIKSEKVERLITSRYLPSGYPRRLRRIKLKYAPMYQNILEAR